MKHIKIFLVLLISAYLFVVPTVTYAMANPNATPTTEESEQLDDVNIIADFSDSMIVISKTVVQINEIDPAVASSIASNFANVMQYAGYAGTVLGLVNGSVAFMRMIGVMKDPTAQKLVNISDQLDNINDKMTEMDNKLNNITSEMAKIEASIEFHARDQKADYLMGKWKDFTYQYMESGLDKSMVEYQSMILNGVRDWCKNNTDSARSKSDVDNNKIILLYKKNSSGGYDLQFTADNQVPRGFSSDDRYIILNKDVLPDNLTWDVEQYTTNIKSAISDGIYRNLMQKNFSAFETQNYPFLTPEGAPKYIDQGPQQEISRIAEDATSVLLYRIASAEVNADAKFTKNLIQQFTNYTNHLLASEEGIDAMLKTMYLTHAFEVQTRSDITDFINRMIVKSGTYGLFVVNILGMSNTTTESEKTTAIEQINKQIKTLSQAKENGITGKDSFSYITNTQLAMVDAHFNGDATLNVRIGPGNRRAYNGFSAKGISGLEHGHDFGDNYSVIGDSNAMLVFKTLQANGIGTDFYTLHQYMTGYANNKDAIITSYSAPQDMALDGTITSSIKNISGDYFKTGIGKNSLPSDASNEYVVFKQKVTGSTYIPSTGQLQSGRNLISLGAYAEEHTMWFVDETAFFGGPADYDGFNDTVDQISTLTETVSIDELTDEEKANITDQSQLTATAYNFNYHEEATYNVIFSIPLPEEEGPANNLLGASNSEEEYNPLISYKNMDMSVNSKTTDSNKESGNIKLAMVIGTGISALIIGLFVFIIYRRNKKVKSV